MKPQAVLVDVSIDQGGCFETSRATTHSNPTYEVDGITHYCVANMPGAVPITSTHALTNATMPYVIGLATHGAVKFIEKSPGQRLGLNVASGQVTYEAVAKVAGVPYVTPEEALGLPVAA
jgi:alanine dehydrogenase